MTGRSGRHAAALVSCDIVEHSRAPLERQQQRVTELNEIVRSVIEEHASGSVLWASGGDGGHVIFWAADWQQAAVTFARRLRRWSIDSDTPLRLAGHHGTIASVIGADGREQPVGDAINMAGRILPLTSASGMAVSADFRRQFPDPAALGVEFHAPRIMMAKDGRPLELYLMSMGDSLPPSTWAMCACHHRGAGELEEV